MGWISGAVCALIAFIFLYRISIRPRPNPSAEETTGRHTNQPKHQSSKTHQTEKQRKAKSPSFAITTPDPPPSIMTNQDTSPEQERSETASTSKATLDMPPPPLPPQPSQSKSASPSLSMAPPRSKSPPRLKPPTFGPTPPRLGGGSLRPPPSAAASLRVPPQKVLQNTSMQPSSLMPPPKNKPSRQVVLEPGHSPLDWAALTSSPNSNLRGKDVPDHLIRVTPSQLKAQNGRKGKDAWTVYHGKVYNITPYVPFHPGGKGEILRGAAKDSVKLFMEVHPWVNWDGMLGECLVGILVAEEDNEPNKLDEMD